MAFTYRGQQMRKWVPLTLLTLGVAFVALLVVVIVRHKPVPAEYYAERPYTQPNGTVVVQQPDHSWLYYYLMMQMNRPVQPTYSVPAPNRVVYRTPSTTYSQPSTPAPNRSSGGFGSTPSPSNRTSGGFSSSPSRSYSSPSSNRTSGGFSSSPSRSYSSPSSSRSSGGFSSSRPSSSGSSSRSSGGFSRPKGGGL